MFLLARAKHSHWLLQSCRNEWRPRATPDLPTGCWGWLLPPAAPGFLRNKPASSLVFLRWLWANLLMCHCLCSVKKEEGSRQHDTNNCLCVCTAVGFPYQPGVVDGDNKVKEGLQSCTVSRRVLLNLKLKSNNFINLNNHCRQNEIITIYPFNLIACCRL